MKKIVISVLLVLMGLEASAQKVDLVKLGNILRNKNLSMVHGVEKGDRFVVRDNTTELVGIMNLKGEMLVQPKYQDIIRKHGGLIYFSISDTTYSLMNHQGQWVVENEYDNGFVHELFYHNEGNLFPVLERGKWGLVDSLGNWLMPMEYESIGVAEDERGWVITEEGLYDAYKKRLLLRDSIIWTDKIGNNLYRVEKRGGKIGIIDTLGQWVVEPKYDYMKFYYSEGLIGVSRNRKWGYIDTLGREVIPVKYEDVGDFHKGLASVKLGGKYGYIDRTGKVVIPFRYNWGTNWGTEFRENGKACVRSEDGYLVIDTIGNVLATFKDVELKDIALSIDANTILWETHADGYFVTDYDGKELARYDDIIFEDCDYYSEEDMIAVKQSDKWGFADKDYRLLVPCQYRRADGYGNGPGGIVTLKDGSTRYIDRKGKTVLKLDGLASVTKVGKDLYKVMIYADGDHYFPVGLADGKGRSTFSKEELRTAKKAYLKRLKDWEEEEIGEDCIVEDFSIVMLDTILADEEKGVSKEVVVDSISIDAYDEVFVFPDEDPMFPGGMDSLYAFLKANIQYPEEAKRDSIEGNVFVQFVIEKDGTINPQTIRVLRDIGGGCREEVVRVIKLMPRWIPARQNGKVVRCNYILPVKFELNKEE